MKAERRERSLKRRNLKYSREKSSVRRESEEELIRLVGIPGNSSPCFFHTFLQTSPPSQMLCLLCPFLGQLNPGCLTLEVRQPLSQWRPSPCPTPLHLTTPVTSFQLDLVPTPNPPLKSSKNRFTFTASLTAAATQRSFQAPHSLLDCSLINLTLSENL